MATPAGWYPLLPAAALRRGRVQGVRLAGRDLAVFRAADGSPGCLAARCSHAGADLRSGTMCASGLRCPLHHRAFAADGHSDGCRQPALPVSERWGLLFASLGDPGFALPAPDGIADALHSRVTVTRIAAPLRLVAANAFDADHFAPVHGRTLLAPPEVWRPAADALAIRVAVAVSGNGWRDRLLRRLGLTRLDIETWCWGGSLLLFHHRRVGVCTVLALRPEDDGSTVAHAVTVRASGGPLARLHLAVQHRLITAFAEQDRRALAGASDGAMELDPGRDAVLATYLAWSAERRST